MMYWPTGRVWGGRLRALCCIAHVGATMDIIDRLNELGHKYPFLMMGLYYLWNSAVQALPTPNENGSVVYKWFFGFAHGVAANFGLIGKTK